jgi:NADH-quinone oxidoreductase subunit C
LTGKEAKMHQELIKDLALRFGISEVRHQRENQVYLKADSSDALALITHLKLVEGFGHLSFLTAVDRIEDGVFDLKYMLHSYDRTLDICVSVPIERDEATADSIHHLWPAAVTYEQELAEMFGIGFPGSPRAGQDFILEGWDDLPPMRRDFDTRAYSEEVYYERPGRVTHDTREHMRKELYPSEAEKW